MLAAPAGVALLAAPAGAAAVVLALSREAQELHLRHLQKRLPRAREEEGRERRVRPEGGRDCSRERGPERGR